VNRLGSMWTVDTFHSRYRPMAIYGKHGNETVFLWVGQNLWRIWASTGLQRHCCLKLGVCIHMFITLQTEMVVSCCLLIVLCVCVYMRACVWKSEATQNDRYNITKPNYDLMFKIVLDILKALKIECLEGVIKEIVHAFARDTKYTKFYILLTVHLVMILCKWPTWRTILFYVFILRVIIYMFRASSCSS